MIGPLDGVRVVEMTSWMAAPGAGAALADMGADVIKVEPLTGDIARGINRKARVHPDSPDIDGSFTVDNRGKRSVAIAIDRPDGAELARRLQIVDLDRAEGLAPEDDRVFQRLQESVSLGPDVGDVEAAVTADQARQ